MLPGETTMKIELNGTNSDPIITQRQNSSSAQPASVPSSTEQDEATLSLDRDGVSTLSSQAMATAPTRQDRIDALRLAVNSGQYKIEPDKIADAMLNASAKQQFPS
jgi:flagellar biosynthesis anti-sigma factor FlgM